ncbi:MAG: YraN family protein [Rickettsiaceae bacterium]|nr:YraN family protein [Rickettsiaceae bacterium]
MAEYLVILRYLVQGFRPIKHRYKSRLGEIDLILMRGGLIVFCEVKARSSDFDQEELVSLRQRSRLKLSAEDFLLRKKKLKIKEVRMDIALVKSIFNIKLYKNWTI